MINVSGLPPLKSVGKAKSKATQKDLFEQIRFDYFYPIQDQQNVPYWVPSQDLKNLLSFIECLELAEEFVNKAVNSTEIPYTIEKSLHAPPNSLAKSPLGGLFYHLIDLANGYSVPRRPNQFPLVYFDRVSYHYECSEYAKILFTAASSILSGANFMENPLRDINQKGLLEGDLINSLVFRLREAASGKKFNNGFTERKRIASQNFKLSKQYLRCLYAHWPSLCSARLFLYHFSSLDPITLTESDRYLKRLLDLLREEGAQKGIVGWWWKREFMSEMGYHYRFLVFFDRQKIHRPSDITDIYTQKWTEVTENKGRCCVALTPEWKWITHGNGILGHLQADHDSHSIRIIQHLQADDNIHSLLLSMNRMLMRDLYMRLADPHFPHFGMGPLPKPADPVLSDNSNSPDDYNLPKEQLI